MATMLFKYPGPHQLQDGGYDYIITEDTTAAIQGAISAGWYRHPTLARAAYEAAQTPANPELPQTVSEIDALRKIAVERGIKYDGRWSVARLKKELDL